MIFNRNGLLVAFHGLHGHMVEQFHNAVQILYGLTHLLFQGIGLLGAVVTDGIVIIPEIIHKFLKFLN